MITYFEYSEEIVRAGRAPATLCTIGDKNVNSVARWTFLLYSERAYCIEGNELTEVKNRYRPACTGFISDEDKVVLKLKAVLL